MCKMRLARSGHQPKIIQCSVQLEHLPSSHSTGSAMQKPGVFLWERKPGAVWNVLNLSVLLLQGSTFLRSAMEEPPCWKWTELVDIRVLEVKLQKERWQNWPRGTCEGAEMMMLSTAAVQEAACHGDGDEHVERAGPRLDAGAGRSGGRVRRAAVRVRRRGVVRVNGLVARQRGGVDRGDCVLRQNLRREWGHYHTSPCKSDAVVMQNASSHAFASSNLSWMDSLLQITHICMLDVMRNLQWAF